MPLDGLVMACCGEVLGDAVEMYLSSTGLDGDLSLEGLASHWVPCLGSADIASLQCVCCKLQGVINTPAIWKELARVWRYTDGLVQGRGLEVPWRNICELHEHLWHAWRGAPVSVRLGVREELRHQKIADLEVLMVEFLAGEDAMVLGHSGGVISAWELYTSEVQSSFSCMSESKLEDRRLVFNPSDVRRIFQEAQTPSRSPSGVQETRTPPPSPWSSGATQGLTSKVLGIFQTSRKHDIQDLCVSPSPASQPSALLLGESIWLAAAVGPNAYIWESTGLPERDRPAAALESWAHRATLSHSKLFPAAHHAVMTVRLRGGQTPHAVTVGEDGVLRAWSIGGCNNGSEGSVLWQHDVGDSRQAVVALVASSSLYIPGNNPVGSIVAVARADERCLQLFHADTGEVVETVLDVWPAASGSLPQAAAYDTGSPLALFSSITETGDGTLARVDLKLPGVQEVRAAPEVAPATVCCSSASRVAQVVGTLAGHGRVLRVAVSVPAAHVLVAVVDEGNAAGVLEVWESLVALGNECGVPCFRRRVQHLLGNQRLVAVGGRRLIMLDPVAFSSRGELRVLEWRARPGGLGIATTRAEGAARCGGRRRWLFPSISGSCLCGIVGCGAGYWKLFQRGRR